MIATNTKRWILGSAAIGMGLLAWPLFSRSELTAQQAPAWSPSIVTIPSPAVSKSGEPQLTVSDRGVLLSWIEHDASTTTLRFAERTSTVIAHRRRCLPKGGIDAELHERVGFETWSWWA